jgi:hypothetical protein
MDVSWATEKPKVEGIYWRRTDEKSAPYLVIVFQGPTGLMARIVEEPVNWRMSWCDDKPIDSAIEAYTGGAWAGPLRRRGEVRP